MRRDIAECRDIAGAPAISYRHAIVARAAISRHSAISRRRHVIAADPRHRTGHHDIAQPRDIAAAARVNVTRSCAIVALARKSRAPAISRPRRTTSQPLCDGAGARASSRAHTAISRMGLAQRKPLVLTQTLYDNTRPTAMSRPPFTITHARPRCRVPPLLRLLAPARRPPR